MVLLRVHLNAHQAAQQGPIQKHLWVLFFFLEVDADVAQACLAQSSTCVVAETDLAHSPVVHLEAKAFYSASGGGGPDLYGLHKAMRTHAHRQVSHRWLKIILLCLCRWLQHHLERLQSVANF